MNKKKILFVITWLWKWWAERQLYNLLIWIKDIFDIKVITFTDWPYRKDIEKLWIKIHLIPMKSNLEIFKAILKTNKIVKQFKPNIIQSILPHANIVAKLVNVLNFKKIKVFTNIRSSKEPKLLEKLEKLTDKFSNKIITNSYTNKDSLIQKWYKEEKIKVIYNWIVFKEAKEKYTYDKKTIITVWRFHPAKDYETNIKTIEKLVQIRWKDDFQVFYVGWWDEKEKIENLVKEKWLEKYIKFLWVRDDIPELMSSADILFFPTKYEWQSNVLLEAMYYKLPILTTDIPENKEICDAIFWKVWDYNFFATKLNEFLEWKLDFTDKIKKNKENIKKFSLDRMIKEYVDLYNND